MEYVTSQQCLQATTAYLRIAQGGTNNLAKGGKQIYSDFIKAVGSLKRHPEMKGVYVSNDERNIQIIKALCEQQLAEEMSIGRQAGVRCACR